MYTKNKCAENPKLYYILIFILFLQNFAFAQSLPDSILVSEDTVLFFKQGNFKYKIPNNCVTSITVQVWGASGAGKGVPASSTTGGGGGGGGAFSSATFTVTPGAVYDLTIGASGAGGTGNGGAGGQTWFGSTTTVLAAGGSGGTATGGAGGAAASGVGSTKYSGGKGGDYAGNGGGGGGASANDLGNGAAGGNGNGNNGGVGGIGISGNGGAGGTNNSPGQDNSQCSGCGGGGGSGTNGGAGGHGAGGLVKIILPKPLNVDINAAQTICPNSTPSSFSAIATGASGGPYTYSWQSSTTDSISGFATIGSATGASYSAGALSVTTWYRCIANANSCLPDTSNTIKITVTNLSGSISFPQTICSGSTPTPFTITTIPSNVAATFVWQSSTTGSGSGFTTIGGASLATYAPSALSAQTWYNAIISATGCLTYTTSALSVTTSNAPATCNAGNPSTIYSTNTLPLVKSSVGGSVTTGAWSVFSSSPTGTHTLSSTNQTNDPAAVTFTPQAGYNGTVVLQLITNANGCNVSICDKTIKVIPATLTAVTFTTSGASTWTVPSCVNQVTVQCWGAGGGGGGANASTNDGGGGGGGAFSSSVLTVTPGTIYNINVGKGGISSFTTKGAKGGDTWFNNPNTVMAQGGSGGLRNGATGENGDPGVGGAASSGYGKIKYSGGTGAKGGLWPGGGGGASAYSTGNGATAAAAPNPTASSNTPSPGGINPTGSDGGNGGVGANSCFGCGVVATAGQYPGGGGGGGTSTDNHDPGNGGDGKVNLLFGPALPVIISMNAVSSVCNGQSTTLTASSDFPINYKWSTGETTDSITVTPTTNTTYTVIDISGCASPVTAPITVSTCTFCTNAVVTLTSATGTNAQTVCLGTAITNIQYSITGGGTNATVTGLPGGVTGIYASGAITISGMPNATGVFNYTVTSSGGCAPVSKIGNITINAIPVVTANTAAVCAGATGTLTASGANSYAWSNGASTATLTDAPIVTTTYTVTGTANGCSSATTSTITINAKDNATFSYTPSTVCKTGGTNPTPIIAGTSGGLFTCTSDNTLPINNTTGVITLSVTPIGSYTISYATSGSCADTKTTVVSIVNVPNAAFSYSGPYCKNITPKPVPLYLSGASAGTFGSTVGLIFGSTTPGEINLSASTAGTYTVINTIAAGGGCPPAKDSSTITINAVPTVTATTATVCAGTTGTITANGATTYTWAGGFPASTTLSDNPLSTKTYTVTGTANGCSANGTGTIYVDQNPIVGVIPPPAAVCPGKTATLTATGATSYVWVGGPGSILTTLTDAPLLTTTYTVTGTTGICKGTATGVITIGSAPIIGAADATICSGSTGATLTAKGGTTYKWSTTPIQTTQSINVNPLVTTTYTVTGTGSTAGCDGVAYPTVFVNATPTALAIVPVPGTICVGQSATLTAYPAGAASYSWSSGENGSVITVSPLVNTPYTVTVTSTNSCFATVSNSLIVNPIPTTGVNNATICSGQTANLTATGAATYTWLPNIGTKAAVSTPTLTVTTSYTVTGNPTTCPAKAIAKVTVNPLPSVVVSSKTICFGEKATLTASGATTYTWAPASNLDVTNGSTVKANPTSTTTYTVTGISANGCIKKVNSTVLVHGLPIINPSSDITIMLYTTTPLVAAGGGTYIWTPSTGLSCTDCSNPIASPTVTTTYCVKVKDSNNCIDSSCVTVSVEIPCPSNKDLAVPNAFSPNGDGNNDIMILKGWGECITEFTFIVYDRWGEKVFESTDPYKTWDGTFRGRPLDPAVFVYFINATFSKGEKLVRKGNISLIR